MFTEIAIKSLKVMSSYSHFHVCLLKVTVEHRINNFFSLDFVLHPYLTTRWSAFLVYKSYPFASHVARRQMGSVQKPHISINLIFKHVLMI